VRTTFFSIFWQYFTFGTILACAALRATLFKKTKTFKEVDERREKRGRKERKDFTTKTFVAKKR
jgi:hypothetical protein